MKIINILIFYFSILGLAYGQVPPYGNRSLGQVVDSVTGYILANEAYGEKLGKEELEYLRGMRVYLKENAPYAHDYLLKDLDNEHNFRAYNEGRGDMSIVLDITGDADPAGAYAVAEKLYSKLGKFVTISKKEYQDYINSNDTNLSAEARDIKIRSMIVPIQSRTYRMERLEAFMQRLKAKYGVGENSVASNRAEVSLPAKEVTSDNEEKTGMPSLFENLEAGGGKIDRKAVVERNSPVWNETLGVMTLGNGEFAFNCDATGLQTFAGNTMAHWAWHSFPQPEGFEAGNQTRYPVDSHGRVFNYLARGSGAKVARTKQETAAIRWYYDNPHMMNLCRIAFRGMDGAQIKPDDVKIVSRKLDLWNGRVESVFEYLGERVSVVSTVHPDADAVGVRVDSALLRDGRLGVVLTFGYPLRTQLSLRRKARPDPNFSSVFDRVEGHKTVLENHGRGEFRVIREMDDGGKYMVRLCGTKGFSVSKGGENFGDITREHTVFMRSGNSESAEFTAIFENLQNTENASDYGLDRVKKFRLTKAGAEFGRMKAAAQKHWNAFWNNGGIADFSASADPRWKELERRVVLSQFLMAANSAGSMPPSEAGLLATDHWCGKFHLEMTAWHGAPYFFWGRGELLKGWVEWFNKIGLKSARAEAAAEGLKGAKWLKTPDPFGRWESWDHGPNRITQNVHPFYLAELSYGADPSAETLRKWKDIIFETTEMMLDFLYWDDASQRYVLGPPLMSGAEGTRGFDCWNSTSELNYWAIALQIAQKWRARLGMPEDEKIAHVLKHISKPPVVDGVYIDAESHPETWDRMPNGRFLRPAWLEVYGCVRGPLIDPKIMERTYDKISAGLRSGDWKGNLWGCDYPMLAMTAARLGRDKEAVDWLLFDAPLNAYTPAGYNAGWYLPGNGGLLWAVALMSAGWEGSEGAAPGFPKDGSWSVKFEGISKVP